ncbi:MAG TPA: DNA topoisomerase IB [Chryseolinea sp.]
MASLQYVNDSMKGIRRKRKGSGFTFTLDNVKVTDSSTLQRIKKLVIPPAWTDVWICSKDNGHLQATGFDALGRKQYKYHQDWSIVRNQTKFQHLYEFGKALPQLRKRIEKDLASSELTKEKVLATVVKLMERTLIRVGSNEYEKLYGSYGLTTMKDGHVNINGNSLKFSFKGKKGIYHAVTIKNKRLARIVKACRDIPGKELFQYMNGDGVRRSIDSGMVNGYIQETTEKNFSAKDIRTWAGTMAFLNCLKSLVRRRLPKVGIDKTSTQSDIKKNIIDTLDEVSARLGNTRAICRKYYVHPQIITLYEENRLNRYLDELTDGETDNEKVDLSPDEKVLMRILKTL